MIIVDSSPVIALIRREEGTENLAAALDGGAITAVNYSEIVARMEDLEIEAAVWRPGLDSLGLELVPFGRRLAERAGMLRRQTRGLGLSLGDRACLALAVERNAPVLTADRAWSKLDLGIEIRLIR